MHDRDTRCARGISDSVGCDKPASIYVTIGDEDRANGWPMSDACDEPIVGL
jgi:hypothetical protein